MDKKLYRSRTDKKVSGVCAGLGTYIGLDPTVVRILWAVLTLATGGFIGIILYIVCIAVIPEEPTVIEGYYEEK